MCVCMFIGFSGVCVHPLGFDKADCGIGKQVYHGCKLWITILANVKIVTAPIC